MRKDLTPDKMAGLTHAAEQVVKGHYGDYVPSEAVEHYLKGGTHDEIADQFKPRGEEPPPDDDLDFSNLAMPDLREILGRK